MNSISTVLRDYLHIHYPASRSFDFTDHDSLLTLGVVDLFGIIDLMSYLERQYYISFDDGTFTPADYDSITKLASAVESRLFISPVET